MLSVGIPIGRVSGISGMTVEFSGFLLNVIQKLCMDGLSDLVMNLASKSLHWFDWRLCWKPTHLKLSTSLQNFAH